MRIAELAVPTKRQCIDTWRNKSDILPEFMVRDCLISQNTYLYYIASYSNFRNKFYFMIR